MEEKTANLGDIGICDDGCVWYVPPYLSQFRFANGQFTIARYESDARLNCQNPKGRITSINKL